MKTFSIFTLFLLLGCGKITDTKRESETVKTDGNASIMEETVIVDLSDSTEKQQTYRVQIPIDKELLLGIWEESPNENAIFKIDDDIILYVEYFDSPFPYVLKEDTLIIEIDKQDFSKDIILKLDQDSLVLMSYETKSILRLHRRM